MIENKQREAEDVQINLFNYRQLLIIHSYPSLNSIYQQHSIKVLQMTAQYCKRAPSHATESIVGICVEDDCSNHPRACRLCLSEFHQGHLILTYDHMVQCEKNTTISKLPEEVVKVFGEQEEKIHKTVLESCQALGREALGVCDKFTSEHPFLKILTDSFKKNRISDIILHLTTSKQVEPELMKSYISMIKTYYFEGGYELSSIEVERKQIQSYMSSAFQKAQGQIQNIIQNLEKNILEYKPFSNSSQKIVKEEDRAQMVAESNSNIMMQEEKDKRMMEEDDIEPQAILRRKILKKFNLSRNQCSEFEKIILRETKECKINVLIPYIDITRIKELTLINNATTCVINKKSAEIIAKMIFLRALRLYWVRDITEIAVCRMLKNLSLLQELCLCEFDSCGTMLINAIKFNNPNLRKVCFNMDILHLVRYSEESLEFIPDIAYSYLAEQSWIGLSTNLPDLATFELHHPENHQYWTKYFEEHASQLTEITLSNIDQTEGSTQTKFNSSLNFTPILDSLGNCKNLRCLRFEQCFFDEKSLVKVIQNNHHLSTFISNECSNIGSKTMAAITENAKNIEELSIQMNDKIGAESFWKMSSLKTLVLRGCWGIKEDKFIESLSMLKKIKCLIIDFNYQWMTAKTLKAISVLEHLKVLNISGNNLTEKDMSSLTIKNLNTLFCYHNSFNYDEIIGLPWVKTLKKLAIGKNIKIFPYNSNLQKIEMGSIAFNFTALTHLKLKGFKKIRPEFLDVMDRIICLNVIESTSVDIQTCKRYCAHNNIYFNESID